MAQALKKDRIIELWKRGIPYKDIAHRVGCDYGYVRAAIQRAKHGGRRPADRVSDARQRLRNIAT
jgi:DNA-directed RNA polymerase specialized sigma24 family protein